jgi:hypothetical protein
MYKNSSPTPNLRQIDLVHSPSRMIHFNIIFPPPRCSKWSPSLRIHYQSPICTAHLSQKCQISFQFFDHSNVHCWLQETCCLTTLFLLHSDRICFYPVLVQAGFLADIVASTHFFAGSWVFLYVNIIPSVPHTHILFISCGLCRVLREGSHKTTGPSVYWPTSASS